jgi:NADPH2:quinone reductase
MQAVRFHSNGGPEVLQVDDVPVPSPKEGEVLVRVEAAGVNYADTVRRWGDHYPLPTPLPFIAGGEIVGVVEEVGPDVDTRLVGCRVFGAPPAGGYAEYCVVPIASVFNFPEGLDPVHGVALFIQGLSAALILRESGRFLPGDNVFVEGAAGGVGSLAVQLAKLYGAMTVIGAASSQAKRDHVLSLGADAAIDYTRPGWSKTVLDCTQEHGVDIVMEMTGGEVFCEAMNCLAPGGRVVVYGIASRNPFLVPTERLISRAYCVVGFYLGHFFSDRKLIEAALAEMADFVRAGCLKVELGGVFGLADAAEAHRQLEGRQTAGKLVLVPNRSS